MAWLGVPAALDRLSYPHDAGVLEEFAAGLPGHDPLHPGPSRVGGEQG